MITTTLQHKLIAKPLLTIDKQRKITAVDKDGTIYLLITPKRYIGKGKTLEEAISNANTLTFSTGYRVEIGGVKND